MISDQNYLFSEGNKVCNQIISRRRKKEKEEYGLQLCEIKGILKWREK